MLGKKGFVARVGRGVDAALEPDEVRQAATYVRGQGGNISVVTLFGPMVAQPFILAVTDRRVLLLAMGQLNAAHSPLIAQIPRPYVHVEDLQLGGVRAVLKLGFATADGPASAQFHLVPAWKQETAELAAALGWQTAASH